MHAADLAAGVGDRDDRAAMIGTPMDVTVEELAIESFYPADETTAAALRAGAAR